MTPGRLADGRDRRAPDRWTIDAPLRRLAAMLPRPLRFLAVGAVGLATDMALFSFLSFEGLPPLEARALSLSLATLVTWRLNRALTFERSGQHPGQEAVRYALVVLLAQGTSYAVFAALALTVLAFLPQAAIVIGAAAAAVVSYNGHRLFSFAPSAAGAARPCTLSS